MVTVIPRSRWTSTPRPDGLTPLDTAGLRGIAVHWTGSATPLGTTTRAGSARRLEAYRRLHTAPEPKGRGWRDIAYTISISQSGDVFDCRGIEHRSAANGDQAVNRSHGAVLFLLGAGELPSHAAVTAFQQWRQAVWLKRWPDATAVVGHRDLHATDCPGDLLYQYVTSGRLAPGPSPQEDPVALSDDDVERIAKRTAAHVADRLLAAPSSKTDTGQTAEFVAVTPTGEKLSITDALTRLLAAKQQ